MRRSEPTRFVAFVIGVGACVAAIAAAPAMQRFAAPITIDRSAPFVELNLPAAAYSHSMQPGLRDLRVVDSRDERVPFALLSPPAAPAPSERLRDTVLYPLPARPADGSRWPSPIDITVQGDRIDVHRAAAGTVANSAAGVSPGWLVDLGETKPGEALPQRLRLAWSAPAEFSAGYSLQTSGDLRSWRAAPGGQLMSLHSAAGVLSQSIVPLPPATGRFVRLIWHDPSSAPALTGATGIAPAHDVVAADGAVELTVAATPGKPDAHDDTARRALTFDLGGELPIVDIDLRFTGGSRVAPVRVQTRNRVDAPWRDLATGLFFRLERNGAVTESPAIAASASVRFVRIVADERAAPLVAGETHLVVHARLASLVFANTGQPPLRLLAGSVDADEGALPASTLLPALDAERPRFGRASLGAFSEVPGAARAAERVERIARFRPWLLWAVLLGGVAALSLLVWRLARSGPAGSPPST